MSNQTAQPETLADRLVEAMAVSPRDRHGLVAALTELLRPLALPPESAAGLAARLAAVARLTDRPATRRSFTLAYLRIHRHGIRTDGRDSSVIVELTTRCNRRCPHCYAAHATAEDLPTPVLDRILEYVRAHAKHLCFTGGEPTLDPRLIPVAEAHPDILFFVFTNGSLFDAAYVQQLQRAPNVVPLLSVDSLTAARHDDGKGSGSFDEVMRAIATLRAAGIPWGYSAVVSHRNAEEVLSPAFIRWMRERGAIVGKYVEYIPLGRVAHLDLIPTGADYAHMERRKKEINARGEIYLHDTEQDKCHGLLFFDVRGRIKACPFLHYSHYAVGEAPLPELATATAREWLGFAYDGECPLYSDPLGLKAHVERLGWTTWKPPHDYLANPAVCAEMSRRYHDFLALRAAERSHAGS